MLNPWIQCAFLSAFGLGIYDVFKKASVHNNAALLTLWVSTSVGSLICLAVLLAQPVLESQFGIPFSLRTDLNFQEHSLIALKALIVSASWVFSYLSMKNLPITIVAPIRASGPLWTLMGAILIFQESLNAYQLLGFFCAMASYLWFSAVGRKDGLVLHRNIWVGCIICGTLIGSVSGLYDKYLIQSCKLNPISVQLWFSIDMFFVQGLIFVIFRKIFPEKTAFSWRWSMPFVAIALLLADAAYFHALQDPEAKIGLLSAMRKGSLLVSFGLGVLIFKEKNSRKKWGPVCGVVLGLAILSWASH
jgi:bacterial/archaeal transporter family protein